MKINYDSKADALDIIFRDGKVHETKDFGNEMFVDVDKSGRPLSIEILDAGKKIGKKKLENITLTFPSYTKELSV